MKKIFLAIALVTAFAAPAMAETFPNVLFRLRRPLDPASF